MAHPQPLPKGGEPNGRQEAENVAENVAENMAMAPKALFEKWQQEHPELFGHPSLREGPGVGQLPSLREGSGVGILLVYITPSGHGLKVVFKARTEWGNLIDNQRQMARRLGVDIDESCKDASRMSFVSRKEDILFINEELFTYENKEFAEKYNSQYRGGNSQPALTSDDKPAVAAVHAAADDLPLADGADGHGAPSGEECADAGRLTYRGVAVADIVRAWMKDKDTEPGNRNNLLLLLAKDMRYITTKNPERLKEILLELCPFVRELEREGDDVLHTVKSACDYKYYAALPKSLQEALADAGVTTDGKPADTTPDQLPLAQWGAEIRQMADVFPCLRQIGAHLADEVLPAALFASSAMMGTLMTRTWYHFYHRPQERRRLNYCIYIIGDPGTGKSFVGELYDVLMKPVIAADEVGYAALNDYKRRRAERQTSSKEQKKEKLEKPQVIIRIHPSRTSNGVFIEDMCNAVDTVDGERMNLHLFTFDAELDNNTLLSSRTSGNWANKETLELKAFHNEVDGQAYANQESVMGMFRVYWNFVYTGTLLSLKLKTHEEQGVARGLTLRMAVLPMPASNYEMMTLEEPAKSDDNQKVLATWAERLDKVHGELPLWPLVKECWEWTRDHMAIAAINQDKADELLLKRIAYYGINVSAPFVLMHHWDEWQQKGTFTIDDEDLRLCRLVLEIQYRTQHYYFGEYTRTYFSNLERDTTRGRTHRSKTSDGYARLGDTFVVDDAIKVLQVTKRAAETLLSRLFKEGKIERIAKGHYKKIAKYI